MDGDIAQYLAMYKVCTGHRFMRRRNFSKSKPEHDIERIKGLKIWAPKSHEVKRKLRRTFLSLHLALLHDLEACFAVGLGHELSVEVLPVGLAHTPILEARVRHFVPD